MPVNWTEFLQQFPPDTPVSVLSRMTRAAEATHATDVPASEAALLRQIECAMPSERAGVLLAGIQSEVARVLGTNGVESIDPQQGFFEMGLDSLMAVELKTRLSSALKRNLPASLMFQSPNIEALAEYLLRELAPVVNGHATAEPPETARDVFDAASEQDLLLLLARELDGTASPVAGESR
jgi:acyl carrier protein